MTETHSQGLHEALEVDAGVDLTQLVETLRAAGIPHRCHERVGRQVVLVGSAADAQRVRELQRALAEGRIDTAAVQAAVAEQAGPGLLAQLRRAPVTATLLGLTLVVFAVTLGGFRSPLAAWLLFLPEGAFAAYMQGGSWWAAFVSPWVDLQLWRLFTPALLHDGPVHLAGNFALIFWFGSRVEAADGSVRVLQLAVFTALLGNLAQFAWSGAPYFGGLSGVVYGLLGYVLLRERWSASDTAAEPGSARYGGHSGLYGMLLLFLVAATFDVLEPFGIHVGNGAHWGGFLTGLACAGLVGPPRSSAGGAS